MAHTNEEIALPNIWNGSHITPNNLGQQQCSNKCTEMCLAEDIYMLVLGSFSLYEEGSILPTGKPVSIMGIYLSVEQSSHMTAQHLG